MALDLLERDCSDSPDDRPDPLRHSMAAASKTAAWASCSELEGLPVREPRGRAPVYCARSGTTSGLVSLLAHHWADGLRRAACTCGVGSALPATESPCSLPVPHPQKHTTAGSRSDQLSFRDAGYCGKYPELSGFCPRVPSFARGASADLGGASPICARRRCHGIDAHNRSPSDPHSGLRAGRGCMFARCACHLSVGRPQLRNSPSCDGRRAGSSL